ncbi:DUF4190 domain-containing protein [Nocardia sp. CDC160]|uniref:DUF4190 domain-containing protein n=1 Tax=Nocardia sp. CDC160 TaxID=3112166 RepID=UPI002DBF7EAF|nr:DUF4190 domain-containing protein [Nocardia sp. CDC160]MEC3914186.1 DUF4190 domain-containing protein [Nocardia sp. CDC160]
MNQYPPPDQQGQYGPPGPYGQYPPQGGGYPPPGGQQYSPGGQQYWTESPKGKGMAITALVFGIVGLLTCWTVLLTVIGILCGLVALVLGVIAMVRARRGAAGGFGMALGGVITGALALIIGVIVGAVVWIFFKDTGGTDLIDCLNKAGNDQSKIQQCQDEFNKRVEDKFSVTLTPAPTR